MSEIAGGDRVYRVGILGCPGRGMAAIEDGHIGEAGARRRQVNLPQADRRHPLVVWREEAGLGGPAEMPRPYNEWLEAEDRRLAG